jgi:tripartite-type tricarboxylate transporter receptor subunit TctC
MAAAATVGAAQTASPELVRVIVGVASGGVVDPYARVVAEHMAKTLGKTIIVENKPGANGNIAAQLIVDAPADGSLIWLGTQSMTEINPNAYSKLRWSMKDFLPIIKGVEAPLVLVTHPSVPAATLTALVEHLRSRTDKPGYASFSPGTPSHFLGFQMNERFGLDMAHIPYRGSGPQVTDLLAGHVLVGLSQLGSTVEHIRAGRLNAIAVTSGERSAFLPDVPTFREAGYPEFTTTVWFGMFVRAGTSEAIVAAYMAAAKAAHADPAVRAKLENMGFRVVAETGPQVSQDIQEQSARWARLIAATGFKAD